MADTAVIATGIIRLSRRNTIIPFFIDKEGVKMTKNAISSEAFFSQFSNNSTKIRGKGHLVFTNLFVTPRNTTFSLSYECDANGAKLTVEQLVSSFNGLTNAEFSGLKVVMNDPNREQLNLGEAAVTMTVMGTPIRLQGQLSEQGFTFVSSEESHQLKLNHIGKANLSKVEVSTNPSRWDKLELLYNFSSGEENRAYDHAPASPRMNLEISNARLVNGGGLEMLRVAEAKAPKFFVRVAKAMQQQKAFTVELWLKSNMTTTNKSSTILSMGSETGRSNEDYFELRLDRDGRLTVNGTYSNARNTFISQPLEAGQLTQVVFTHEANGTENFYLNGQLVDSKAGRGEVQAVRNEALSLFLANNSKKEDRWRGEFHNVAIYSRAISGSEIANIAAPFISTTGTFEMANAPNPLNQPLAAEFQLWQDQPQITVEENRNLSLRPELNFSHLHLQWIEKERANWKLTGEVEASLWGNTVNLLPSLDSVSVSRPSTNNDPRLVLTQNDRPITIELDKLGKIDFASIKLNVPRDGNTLRWELSSTSDQAFCILPNVRYRAFDLFSDFLLEEYQLALSADHLLLEGGWLGETIHLHAARENTGMEMLAATAFDMVFDLTIPTIHDPQTGEVLDEGRELPDQTIQIDLALELSENGMLTNVNSNFDWVSQDGAQQVTVVPEFKLYTPPPSKNALLGKVNTNIEANINELFASSGRQTEEYYLDVDAEQPFLYFNKTKETQASMKSVLPAIANLSNSVASTNNIFQLVPAVNDCTLTISIANKTTDEIDAAYLDLIGQLSELNISFAALSLIQRRIAERLSLSADRLLYYYYGWDKTNNHIDLHPGMRLRIDYQNYQFVQPSDQTAKRGFSGSGSSYLELGTYTRKLSDGTYEQCLGFDGFLSQLNTEAETSISTEGAGSAFDLLKENNRKPAYRLFLPSKPSMGLGPERVATIIGTDSMAEMIKATTDFNPDGNLASGTGFSFFFRGKATIRPEMQVFVRDQALYVPVGATVRQLIQRFDDIPQAGIGSQDLSAFLKSERPLRLIHEGVNSTPSYRFMNIKNTQSINKMDVLDLPLVKGDRFYF